MDRLKKNEEELDLKELYKLVDEACNIIYITEHFCKDFQEIEEICCITPLINLAHQKLDTADCMLINAKVYRQD